MKPLSDVVWMEPTFEDAVPAQTRPLGDRFPITAAPERLVGVGSISATLGTDGKVTAVVLVLHEIVTMGVGSAVGEPVSQPFAAFICQLPCEGDASGPFSAVSL